MRVREARRIRHGIRYAKTVARLFALYPNPRDGYYVEMNLWKRGPASEAYRRTIKTIEKKRSLAEAHAKGRALGDVLARP
jgi:hypothetical protein